MKSFEFGTVKYWAYETLKSITGLTMLCKGLLAEAADIAKDKERERGEAIDDYENLRTMCRAVVDAEDEYDRHLFMLKDAQERERAQQDAEPNEEPNGEEDS